MKSKILVMLAVIISGAAGFWGTKNDVFSKIFGAKEKTPAESEQPQVSATTKPAPSYPTTVGNFLVTDKEVCLEDGKPIVYFFGSSGCSHCVWEKPVAQKVFGQFKNEIAYHENFDSDKDGEVFAKYGDINPGYVPFLILGCKYARMGAGENLGKDDAESKKLEEEALTAILCKLTDGKPSAVCNLVK